EGEESEPLLLLRGGLRGRGLERVRAVVLVGHLDFLLDVVRSGPGLAVGPGLAAVWWKVAAISWRLSPPAAFGQTELTSSRIAGSFLVVTPRFARHVRVLRAAPRIGGRTARGAGSGRSPSGSRWRVRLRPPGPVPRN